MSRAKKQDENEKKDILFFAYFLQNKVEYIENGTPYV